MTDFRKMCSILEKNDGVKDKNSTLY